MTAIVGLVDEGKQIEEDYAVQMAVRLESDKAVELVEAPLAKCRHNRFNTRKTRDEESMKRLAERILRNGFEQTRAVWAIEVDGAYEVFAGGSRLEAARMAGLEAIPVMVHSGFSDDEISRRADEDNENDEYHQPVNPVDVWAEYARLRDEERWSQERITKAKGVDKGTVSRRIKFHGLSETVKGHVGTGDLTEGHLKEITEGIGTFQLPSWLTTARAWEELAAKAVYDKGKNGEKSVRAIREDVATWREFIEYAQRTHEGLPESETLHALDEDPPRSYSFNARQRFVSALAASQARSLPKVKAAEREVRGFLAEKLADYERYVSTRSTEAAQAAGQAERERRLLAKFHMGDCVDALRNWPGGPIRLLLTDPPYGVGYQSNRRWRTKAPARLIGDTPEEALSILAGMLEAAVPHLADDAHVLVFCDWETEPQVRNILADAGLRIKPTLNWLKDEHSAGDVRGSFAPDYERIVHAVKGNPEVTPRRPTTLKVARSRETTHPTEKPVELLLQLIDSTTAEGELVADPFAGCASTLVAALRAGRDFWGAEIDDRFHDEGCGRLLREAASGA